MCHFDQVWTTHYEPAKKVLFKPTEKAGQVDAEGYKPSTEKMLNSIKRALRIHDHDDSVAKAAGPAPPTLCAQSTLVPVEYNRNARTTRALLMELWGEHMSQLLQLQCQGLNDYGIVISSLFEASGKSRSLLSTAPCRFMQLEYTCSYPSTTVLILYSTGLFGAASPLQGLIAWSRR